MRLMTYAKMAVTAWGYGESTVTVFRKQTPYNFTIVLAKIISIRSAVKHTIYECNGLPDEQRELPKHKPSALVHMRRATKRVMQV